MSLVRIDRVLVDDNARQKGIIGNLYIDDILICNTLEPFYAAYFGAVDPGLYPLDFKYSPTYGKNMWYLDTSLIKRSGIMFHLGNTSKNTKGCILVGYNLDNSFFLSYSRVAYSFFLRNLDPQNVNNVVISDKFV